MKIVFFGTPNLAIPILKTLCDNYEVSAVVTAPDKPKGRKKELTPSAIASAYESYLANPNQDFNILKPERIDQEFVEEMRKLSPDMFVVAAYGGILPQHLLEIPKHGALNVHPSLLPKYRGASPIQSAILSGDLVTGVTFIKMDEQMDHGPIIDQFKESINPHDTFETLGNRLFEKATEKLPEAMNTLAHNQTGKIQDENEATFCKILTKEDGFIDLDQALSPAQIERMIRAFYPWPGVWTKWNGKIIKFYPSEVIQIEGKNPVPIHTFINGYPDSREFLEKLGLS